MFNAHRVTLQGPDLSAAEGGWVRFVRAKLHSIARCPDICSAAGEE